MRGLTGFSRMCEGVGLLEGFSLSLFYILVDRDEHLASQERDSSGERDDFKCVLVVSY